MRPHGEIREALLCAAAALVTDQRAPTFREIAAAAAVGYDAALHTVRNMARAGELVKVRERRVDYRNRPVAEYAPRSAEGEESAGFVDLGSLLTVWK